jgi:hypothetical protein
LASSAFRAGVLNFGYFLPQWSEANTPTRLRLNREKYYIYIHS